MAKREISNLDLKIKLTNEFLRNGGVEKIPDVNLLEDLINIKFDNNSKADPDTVSPRVNAFMLAILGSHLNPPFYSPEHISEYASTLQKANCFEQQNIDTIDQFDKIYEEYKTKLNILFRGQREAKWRLYNTLQREWIEKRLFEKGKSYQEFIEKLVLNGKADFNVQLKELLDSHNIDVVNSISVLGFLQQHKCPTPLLDWTFKFQNALFFGIKGLISNQGSSEIEDYFSVFFIEEEHMESSSMRTLMTESLTAIEEPLLLKLIAKIAKDEKQRKEMGEYFKGRKLFERKRIHGSGLVAYMTEIKHMINIPISYFSDNDADSGVIFSLNNSKNILNQAGVYTWNANPTKPIEMVGNEQYNEARKKDKPEDYRFCSCFNIKKNLANHIRSCLEEDGITEEFIYPTTDINTFVVFEKCLTK